jgi:hypothetical protein
MGGPKRRGIKAMVCISLEASTRAAGDSFAPISDRLSDKSKFDIREKNI